MSSMASLRFLRKFPIIFVLGKQNKTFKELEIEGAYVDEKKWHGGGETNPGYCYKMDKYCFQALCFV